MNQFDAFDSIPPRFPRARRSDAKSSHEAAAEVERSGSAKRQAQEVLQALERWPGSTSAELARSAKLNRQAVARRLPELYRANLITRNYSDDPDNPPCTVSGKRALRWWPK